MKMFEHKRVKNIGHFPGSLYMHESILQAGLWPGNGAKSLVNVTKTLVMCVPSAL